MCCFYSIIFHNIFYFTYMHIFILILSDYYKPTDIFSYMIRLIYLLTINKSSLFKPRDVARLPNTCMKLRNIDILQSTNCHFKPCIYSLSFKLLTVLLNNDTKHWTLYSYHSKQSVSTKRLHNKIVPTLLAS